ncbi:MAG: GAF domain-containing SpoIIE family protein phosphatase [bacterium]
MNEENKQTEPSQSEFAKLRSENAKLRRAVEELSVLNELASAIGASRNSEEVMRKIVRRSLHAAKAEQGVITLIDKNSQQPTKTLVRTITSSSEHQPFHANQSLVGWMIINKKFLIVNNPQNDARFKGVSWDETILSLVCVPLMVKSQMIGVLTLYNKKDKKDFTDEDQRLLSIIAGQSAQVIENARLYEEEKALLSMKEELRLAYEIQITLLPKEQPEISGYDIAGKSIPAQNVGGDYFDFIPVDTERIAICLADITGKGMPAALLMANLLATIRGQTLANLSAGPCLDQSNILLYQSTDSQKFATLFYSILDFRNHTLNYSNAGHNDPLLFSENHETKSLHKGGIMLGALPGMSFEEENIPFQKGDLLVLYSDGITEAEDENEDEFGEDRLLRTVQKNRSQSANELIETIIAEVRSFAGEMPQSDDMTLVVIKRT